MVAAERQLLSNVTIKQNQDSMQASVASKQTLTHFNI